MGKVKGRRKDIPGRVHSMCKGLEVGGASGFGIRALLSSPDSEATGDWRLATSEGSSRAFLR